LNNEKKMNPFLWTFITKGISLEVFNPLSVRVFAYSACQLLLFAFIFVHSFFLHTEKWNENLFTLFSVLAGNSPARGCISPSPAGCFSLV